MIIGYTQEKDSIKISYVSNENKIDIEDIHLEDGYFKMVECDDFDLNKIPNLVSFHGSSIKKEKAKYFVHHNINEFFNIELKKHPKYDLFSKINVPKVFSVDIEVEISEKYGYSKQTEAKNQILSISITDESLNSILFIVKNEKHPKISDLDLIEIDNHVKESLKDYANKYDYNFDIRIFDSEIEMLNVFLECINKHFHLIIGWNILDFDWQYIFNRCLLLNIDVKKASPIRKLTKITIDINERTKINLEIPSHRIINDYMILFKQSLVYNNLGSYSLDNVSELVLNLNKLDYDGNLRELYKDYLKFIAYAFVDTILVMLIHKATNFLIVDFFQSYYNNVPYLKLSQNSISEALVYTELRKENIFLLESEKTNSPIRGYQGGYVKPPTKKIVLACFGLDFKALYPNAMITMGLSPEAKIDKIINGPDGFPINDIELKKWEKYKSLGYSLTPAGNIYDMSKDFLYTRIEKGLLNARGVFQNYAEDIYLNVIPKIENKLNL